MRWIVRLVILVLVLVVGFFGTVMLASEYGGEVVVLHTKEGDADKVTHLWVVDDAGFAWLRAGTPGSGWLKRIDANPDVTVERAGQSYHMRAVPVREPVVRDRIHTLMREKYPFADRLISVMRDGNSSVPVRLETVQAE
jgi:hypothetical protein